MTKFAERKKKWGTEMVFQSISLPVNIIEKLKLLKEQYEDCYGRKVSYGEIFERLFSPMALGNVDPGVYARFEEALKTRAEFDEVVTRATKRAVDDLARRAEENGTSLAEEAEKERKAVVDKMDHERRIYAEKEARCIEIVKAASPALPTEKNWAKGEWFVNEESGLFFPVLQGKYGKTDYATVNGKVFNRHQVSDKDLLSPDGGFIRVTVEL